MKKAGWVRLTSAEEKELQEKFNVHVGVQDVGVDWKKFKAWMREKGMRPNGTGTPRIRFDGNKKDVHVSI